jgi:hypothetical protein
LIAAEEYQYSVDWLLKHWNEKLAIQFVDAVENKITLLKKFPLLVILLHQLLVAEKHWFRHITSYYTK